MSRTSKLIVVLMLLAMAGAWLAPEQTKHQAAEVAARKAEEARLELERSGRQNRRNTPQSPQPSASSPND